MVGGKFRYEPLKTSRIGGLRATFAGARDPPDYDAKCQQKSSADHWWPLTQTGPDHELTRYSDLSQDAQTEVNLNARVATTIMPASIITLRAR